MSSVERVFLIRLDGETPTELGLPALSHLADSMRLVEHAVSPFMTDSASVVQIEDITGFPEAIGPESNGITVIYVVGHGWRGDDGFYHASIRSDSTSVAITGDELMRLIGNCVSDTTQLLLLVDTCESESLSDHLHLLPTRDYTVIFASTTGERAWNVKADRGTQFAFAVSEVLTSSEFCGQIRDAVELSQRVQSIIEQDVSAQHQTVSRRVSGRPLLLSSSSSMTPWIRRRRALFRLLLRTIGISVVATAVIAALGLYWRNHVFLVINLGELETACREPELIVNVADPASNSQNEICRMRVDGHVAAWLFLPTDNLIVSVTAKYNDGQKREIRFHRHIEPGLSDSKSYRLTVPNVDEITANPNMAFVSTDAWLQGEHRDFGPPLKPFWIDISQTKIRDYLAELLMMFKQGQLKSFESVLLTDILRNTNFSEDELPLDVEQLFALLSGTDSMLSHPDCPAPMTEVEAELLASRLNKRSPTKTEWELAARGVDGRRYPWGELIDVDAVNAGLPRGVGWEHRRMLRPSIDFPKNRSPFGLFDTVGNAGDWVRNEDGFGFMGGELRLNPEDCTTYGFMRLPSSHSGLADFAWRIGFRGVRSSSSAH